MTTFEEIMTFANSTKPATIGATLQKLFPAIHAAKLLDTETAVVFQAIRAKTKVPISGLQKDWQKFLVTRDATAKQEAAAALTSADVEAAADKLLRQPDLLARAVEVIGSLGVVGERGNRGLLYCALTSRLMSQPISAFLKGRSASGKSNLIKQALKLMPPESYYEFTAMSAKALIYAEELELKHKHLVIYEEDGNEETEYLVRSLLSEGRISYLTAEKTAKGIAGRRIEREGPTGLLTTMTRAKVREDQETRAWSLYVDDSKDQTLRVVEALARAAANEHLEEIDTRHWQVAQRKLKPLGVILPFAPKLAELLNTADLSADSTRLRRDFGRLQTLVKVIALLYQYQRSRTNGGQLVATIDDYRMAHELVAATFAASARDLSPQALKLAKAVRELYDAQPSASPRRPITPRQIEGKLRWSRPTILKWLGQAEAAGLLETESGKGNQPTAITPVGEVPDIALELLPKPDDLEKFMVQSHPLRFNAKEVMPSDTAQPALSTLKTALTVLNPSPHPVLSASEGEDPQDLNAVNTPLRKPLCKHAEPDAKDAENGFALKRKGTHEEQKNKAVAESEDADATPLSWGEV